MNLRHAKNFIDMTGTVYGDLTVIEIDEEKTQSLNRERVFWVCECTCGGKISLDGGQIRANKARTNCKCKKIKHKNKKEKPPLTQMEQSLQRIKSLHYNMMYRCHDKKSPDYANYGAKGITVSPEWHDKETFIADMWDAYLLYEKEHGFNTATIDRIDNDKGYSKDNCRWLTRSEQIHNRSVNRTATVDGVFYSSIGKLHEAYPHIPHHTLIYRHQRGWIGDELVLPLGTLIKRYRAQQNNS